MVVTLVLDVEFHVAFAHKVGVLGKHNIIISENNICGLILPWTESVWPLRTPPCRDTL